MEQRGTPGTLLAARLLLGAAVVGLMAVGVVEMQASLLAALLSVAAFGFVVANVVLWQNGERSGRLWRRSAALALKAVTLLLVFVGSISVLDGGTALVGVAMLLVWWALSGRGLPGVRTGRVRGVASERDPAPRAGPGRPAPGQTRDERARKDQIRDEQTRDEQTRDEQTRDEEARDEEPADSQSSPEPDAGQGRPVPSSGRELELWLLPGACTVGDVESLVRALDAPSLARAWIACRAKGAPQASVQEQMGLARLRQVLLDEMERRDPVAFAAWMARGAPDGPPLSVDGR